MMGKARISYIRSALYDYITYEASGHQEKAKGNQDGKLHARSALALCELAEYVEALPDTDTRLAALADRSYYLFQVTDDILTPGVKAAGLVLYLLPPENLRFSGAF
jgi:hypothetical protein